MPPQTPPKLNFFKKLSASIYSPEFYASIPKRKFGSAFGYLLLLSLLLMILGGIVLGVPLVSERDKVGHIIDTTLTLYPEELIVTAEGGKISTNVEEPYFITSEAYYLEEGKWEETEFFQNIIVIDTITPFSAEQFMEYKSLAWLTEDTLFTQGDDELKTIPLNEMEDGVLDKEKADFLLQKGWDTAKPFFVAGVLAVIIMMYIGLIIFRMIYALLLGLLIWIVGSIMNLEMDYGASYKMSLHAMTPSLLIMFLIHHTSQWTTFNGFFLLFTVIAVATATINLINAKNGGFIKVKKT